MEAARARLDREASDDREREAALRTERADLAAERDPKPADPPWLDAGRAGEPLWRCVDFADQVSNEQRAGLEGALLAAGLLSAVVQPDGTVLAADGELLMSPGTARPGRPLATALRPIRRPGCPRTRSRPSWPPSATKTPARRPRCSPTGAGVTGHCGGVTSPNAPGTSARPPAPRTGGNG